MPLSVQDGVNIARGYARAPDRSAYIAFLVGQGFDSGEIAMLLASPGAIAIVHAFEDAKAAADDESETGEVDGETSTTSIEWSP